MKDMERQALNVFRMRLLGAEVRAVHSGTKTLKDACSAAIRDWVTNVEDTHYILGSVAGPHPFPVIVSPCLRGCRILRVICIHSCPLLTLVIALDLDLIKLSKSGVAEIYDINFASRQLGQSMYPIAMLNEEPGLPESLKHQKSLLCALATGPGLQSKKEAIEGTF